MKSRRVNKNGEQMLVSSFSVDKNTLSYQIPPSKISQNTANDKSSIVSFLETVVTDKTAFELNMSALNIGVTEQHNSTVTHSKIHQQSKVLVQNVFVLQADGFLFSRTSDAETHDVAVLVNTLGECSLMSRHN